LGVADGCPFLDPFCMHEGAGPSHDREKAGARVGLIVGVVHESAGVL